ncbi:MAG TPA: tetratricopeptide repeat protein [Thermoguttaceae bacterium]|nr:tetratricopeptide repeat protein [Thermoguttaceae bacterium]HPP53263.1 tetratricopeptide repeat protein [Thermoguttaceae bacterium]
MWTLPGWANRPNGKKPASLAMHFWGPRKHWVQAVLGVWGGLGRVVGLAVCLVGWGLGEHAAQAQQTPQQDIVEWDPGGSGVGRARLSGRVIDYTGGFLLLQLPDGREQKIPGQKVLRIETQYGPAHQEAEQRFRQGRLAEALGLYRKAVQEEQRRWVRREILARMVVCYEDTGQAGAAGETFLLLVQSDPNTPYWEVIPLAWAPTAPDGLLERQARQWLAQDVQQAPVAVLLGASHLLSGAERGVALDRLNQLTHHPDQRISLLALAQTWRTLVQVEPAQLEVWERTIQKMPERFRPGPYYVLGRAYAQQGRWEEAALAWLRIPILYGRPRSLAARALVETGAALQRLGQAEQSARLYQELLRSYPDSPSAAEAAQRLEELQKETPSPKP